MVLQGADLEEALALEEQALGDMDRLADRLPDESWPLRLRAHILEQLGRHPEAAAAECDHLARIPMAPGVDSLNVGVATAVCLHRFSRGART